MRKLFIAIVVLLVCYNGHAQEMQINGNDFDIVKKSTINTSVEFFQVKQKKANGVQESYIKVNGVFSKTDLKEAELKTFLATGKASSFGTLSTKQIKKGTFYYSKKGNLTVFVANDNNMMIITEITGNNGFLFQKPTAPGPGGETLESCSDQCWTDYMEGCTIAYSTCEAYYTECIASCNDSYGNQNKAMGIKQHKIPDGGVKIKFQ